MSASTGAMDFVKHNKDFPLLPKEWGSFPSRIPLPSISPSSHPLLPPASDLSCNIKSPRIAREGKRGKEGMEVEGSDGS